MKRLIVLFLAVLLFLPIVGTAQTIYVVYAVGNNGTLLQLVDGQWVAVDPGYTGNIYEIWGSSEYDIYAATGGNALLHYDGIDWQAVTIPDATPAYFDHLSSVSGTGPFDVYAGGYEYRGGTDCYPYFAIAYHFDGVEWTFCGDPGYNYRMTKLWANPGGGFYGMAYYWHCIAQEYLYLVPRYDGDGNWSTELEEAQYDLKTYRDIDGYGTDGPVVAGERLFEIGLPGIVWKRESPSKWTTLIQDDYCLYPECSYWPYKWMGIFRLSETDFWVAGTSGRVIHWTPEGYTEYDTGVTETLRAIWGSSNNDIYAGGDLGIVFHFNGSTWEEMTTPTTETLGAIWGFCQMPTAALLQSFSTDTDAGHVAIRWSLSEIVENVEFRVSRSSGASAATIDENPDIERDGLSFTYLDHDVEPEGEYSYLVECSDEDGWIMLFDTGRIVIPGVQLALMPNYPNPFNPSTRITYSVPEPGHVSLKIYDVTGRLVRTLIEELKAPGTYSVSWNGLNDQGRNAATGTYFCRLVTAKRAVTRKMLLAR